MFQRVTDFTWIITVENPYFRVNEIELNYTVLFQTQDLSVFGKYLNMRESRFSYTVLMGIKYNQSRFSYFFIYKDFSISYLADFTTEIYGASQWGSGSPPPPLRAKSFIVSFDPMHGRELQSD